MKHEDKLKQKYGTDPGFRTPDAYFDHVFAQISAELPEYPQAETIKSLSRWQRLKPYIYMAAMFGGIWCTMKMVSMISDSHTQPISLDNPPELVAQAMQSPEVLAQVYSNPSFMIVEDNDTEELLPMLGEEQVVDNTNQEDITADNTTSEAGEAEYSDFICIDDIDLNQLQAALEQDNNTDEEYYYYI